MILQQHLKIVLKKQEYRLLMHVFNKNKLVYKINDKIAKSVAK